MKAWGLTLGPERLHFSQAKCGLCALVFSNPVCDWSELEAFYRNDYWESHWPGALSREPEAIKSSIAEQRAELEKLMSFAGGGRLLEVGSGTGSFLAAARDSGFDVWGLETSTTAVNHAREVFGLENVIQGSFPDERLGAGTFDVIYAWHVIEHVVDLDEFISSLSNLLKAGGILWIGTENYRNATHYLDRAISQVRGDPPAFATASEHTLAFTRKTLTNALERRGWNVLKCETYQPSLREKLTTMHFRTPFSYLYFVAQHAANAAARTGPLMRLAARKP